MSHFAIASLIPFALLLSASLGVDGMAFVALIYMTLGVAVLDLALPRILDPRHMEVEAKALPVVLAVLHLASLPLVIWALVAAEGRSDLSQGAMFLSAVMIYGQISNSNAHELIHAPTRLSRRLGSLVYASLMFGHHTSSHLAVHHVHVATDLDPNSAREGEGLYAFWLRAWTGSFLAGLEVEARRQAKLGRQPYGPRHPYWGYLANTVALLAVSAAIAGVGGVVLHILLGLAATSQLLTSDYVQHYGLRRAEQPGQRAEPVGPSHSWDAPDQISRLMLLNAPLHAEHHVNPATRFPQLGDPDRPHGPTLPYSLPVMAAIAHVPPLWKRVMSRELIRLHLAQSVPPMPQPRRRNSLPSVEQSF